MLTEWITNNALLLLIAGCSLLLLFGWLVWRFFIFPTLLKKLEDYYSQVVKEINGLAVNATTQFAQINTRTQNLQQMTTALNADLSTAKNSINYLMKKSDSSTSSFSQLTTMAQGLGASTAKLTSELSGAREKIAELTTVASSNQKNTQQNAEVLAKLELVIAGSKSKGQVGENILEAFLATLPPEWYQKDYHINGKTVEYVFRLPNHLVLPIDSKWPASNLLELFAKSENAEDRRKLKDKIGKEIAKKAEEVRQYIRAGVTTDFVIMAVPDSVAKISSDVVGNLFQKQISLVSYSLLVPYLLVIYRLVLNTQENIDLANLKPNLIATEAKIAAVEKVLSGKMPKAISMLRNAHNELDQDIREAHRQLKLLIHDSEKILPDPNNSRKTDPQLTTEKSPLPDEKDLPAEEKQSLSLLANYEIDSDKNQS